AGIAERSSRADRLTAAGGGTLAAALERRLCSVGPSEHRRPAVWPLDLAQIAPEQPTAGATVQATTAGRGSHDAGQGNRRAVSTRRSGFGPGCRSIFGQG